MLIWYILLPVAAAQLAAELAWPPSHSPAGYGLGILNDGRRVVYYTSSNTPFVLPGSSALVTPLLQPYSQILDDTTNSESIYICASNGTYVYYNSQWSRRHVTCGGIAMSDENVFVYLAASSQIYVYARTDPAAPSHQSINVATLDSTWQPFTLQMTDNGESLAVVTATGTLGLYNLTSTPVDLITTVSPSELDNSVIYGAARLAPNYACYMTLGRAPCYNLLEF
jgi:hypothetical protein